MHILNIRTTLKGKKLVLTCLLDDGALAFIICRTSSTKISKRNETAGATRGCASKNFEGHNHVITFSSGSESG